MTTNSNNSRLTSQQLLSISHPTYDHRTQLLLSPVLMNGTPQSHLRSLLSPSSRIQFCGGASPPPNYATCTNTDECFALSRIDYEKSPFVPSLFSPSCSVMCTSARSEEMMVSNTSVSSPLSTTHLQGDILASIRTSVSISELVKLRCCLHEYPAMCRAIDERKMFLLDHQSMRVTFDETTQLDDPPTNILIIPSENQTDSCFAASFLSTANDGHADLIQIGTASDGRGGPIQDLTTLSQEVESDFLRAQGDTEIREVLRSVEELRSKNHVLLEQVREGKQLREASLRKSQELEGQMMKELTELQQKYDSSCLRNEDERDHLLCVQESLKQRLEEAKNSLERVTNERQLVLKQIASAVGDEDMIRQSTSFSDHTRAMEQICSTVAGLRSSVQCLEERLDATTREYAITVEAKQKSESLCAERTKTIRSLQRENQRLLNEIKEMTNRLQNSSHEIETMAQKQVKAESKWKKQASIYDAEIAKLKTQVRSQKNSVPIGLYRAAMITQRMGKGRKLKLEYHASEGEPLGPAPRKCTDTAKLRNLGALTPGTIINDSINESALSEEEPARGHIGGSDQVLNPRKNADVHQQAKKTESTTRRLQSIPSKSYVDIRSVPSGDSMVAKQKHKSGAKSKPFANRHTTEVVRGSKNNFKLNRNRSTEGDLIKRVSFAVDPIPESEAVDKENIGQCPKPRPFENHQPRSRLSKILTAGGRLGLQKKLRKMRVKGAKHQQPTVARVIR